MGIDLIVHFPEDEASRQALAEKAALVHAQAIAGAVRALPCPAEQKSKLLDAVQAYINRVKVE